MGGGKGEYYSGTGSTNTNTIIYINHLISFIKENNIKKVFDIGCGDFRIMQQVTEKINVEYIGSDVVKELIAHHKANYGNERTHFIHLNAINDELPPADLVVIRQVLQHLNNEDIGKILTKLPNYKYVIITEHLPLNENIEFNLDKIAGPHIRMRVNSGVFINKPPFNIKNTSVLFEYRQDDLVKGKMIDAVIRTYLIKN